MMLSYKDFTKYFGLGLLDKDFQSFLTSSFTDLTDYDILEGDYICSELTGIEIGFTNKETLYDDDENVVFEKGNPIFSHFTLHPKSSTVINDMPFGTTFIDKRSEVISKAGSPARTKSGFVNFLNRSFLVDNYKLGDIIITFDYDFETNELNFIQVRDNNLVEHLKL
jgi:hypothetical protein